MIYLIAAILFLSVLYWKVNRDYNLWLKDIPVKHSKSWRLLCFLLSPTVIMLAIPLHWLAILLTAPLAAFWWWFLFDGWYNNKRKFNWWFTGSNDSDDAKTDNFLQKLKQWQHKAIKIGSITITTTIYILWLFHKKGLI